jgi:hypothetical protein
VCVPPPPPQTYALDTKTLAIIQVVVFAVLEGKRYEGFKKTGGVSAWLAGWLGSVGTCADAAVLAA